MEEKSSYSIFSKTFNKILDKNTSYLYQAISKLHVIKNHSEYFSKFKKKNNFLEKIIQKLYFFLRENKMFYSHKSLTSCECLIISNIIKYKKIGVFKDNYFGNLEKQLNELNLKSIKVYRNLEHIKLLNKDKFLKKIFCYPRIKFNKGAIYFFILTKFYFLIKLHLKIIFKKTKYFDFFTIPGNLNCDH